MSPAELLFFLATVTALIRRYQSLTTDAQPVIVEIHSPIIKGALIDDYLASGLIIKLTPPSKMINDALSNVDKERTPREIYESLREQLGYLEKTYQKQFIDMLNSFQQMITTPYPQVVEGKSQKFDLTHLSRLKRNPVRVLMAFLRVIKPVARVGGKLTKYGRFIKTLKYSGYIASAGVFAYEMADIFGAIPDHKYDVLSRQLQDLYEKRTDDLKIIDKVALVTMSLNTQITDITLEFHTLISEVENSNEIKMRGSHILTNYLNQLSFSIMVLLNGKLPTFLMILDLQKRWLEEKMHSGLLLYISSISPHLKLELKAIDEERGQLVLKTEIPVPDSRFQLLHYVQWEPKFWKDGKCYSAPTPYFYLAYPSSRSSESVITNPYLIDPRSCLADGFLMCESDSILKLIPDLVINEICSALPMISKRKKRSTDEVIEGPYYNLTGIIDRSLSSYRRTSSRDTENEIIEIRNKLSEMISANEKQKEEAKRIWS